MAVTPTEATPLRLRLNTNTARELLASCAELPPEVRRDYARRLAGFRRQQLRTMIQMLNERDGAHRSYDAAERRDPLLADLTILETA